MARVKTAVQRHEIDAGEIRTVLVDFTSMLEDNSPIELLTGTPTIVDAGATSPLQIVLSNKAVSTGALTINGVSVITGRAVTFKVDASAAVSGTEYNIDITCSTNASVAQTLKLRCVLVCT